MKHSKVLALVLMAGMLLAACGESTQTASTPPTESPASSTEEPATPSATESSMEDVSTLPTYQENFLEQIKTLTPEAYPELEVTAAILERRAILPGLPIHVNVTVKNNGAKTVVYTQGSGTYKTPQALYVYADGLQTALPEEYYGPATMDLRYETLEPGASVDFTYTIMAVKQNPEFDEIALQALAEEKYIGDMDIEELKALVPSAEAAEPGSYTANAYFIFQVIEPEAMAETETMVEEAVTEENAALPESTEEATEVTTTNTSAALSMENMTYAVSTFDFSITE